MSLQKQCQDALFFAQNHRRFLHQQPELSWQEESTAGVGWCSHKPGVIHACGHDGHPVNIPVTSEGRVSPSCWMVLNSEGMIRNIEKTVCFIGEY